MNPRPVVALALLTTAAFAASPAWPKQSPIPAPATPMALATDDSSIAAFSAHYGAEWKGISVGTSDLELKADTAPDTYEYTWTMTAHGIFRLVYPNDVIQKSWFSVIHDHVRPERYRAEDGSSTATVDFDWPKARGRGETEKKAVDVKLGDGTQDIMSIQVEVMLDLKNGNLPRIFHILDKDEVKDFEYTKEGTAKIRTALGMLDTVVVSNKRVGGNRILRMWFAPSLGYLPVLAERSRDSKVEFAMKIKSIKGAASSG